MGDRYLQLTGSSGGISANVVQTGIQPIFNEYVMPWPRLDRVMLGGRDFTASRELFTVTLSVKNRSLWDQYHASTGNNHRDMGRTELAQPSVAEAAAWKTKVVMQLG